MLFTFDRFVSCQVFILTFEIKTSFSLMILNDDKQTVRKGYFGFTSYGSPKWFLSLYTHLVGRINNHNKKNHREL
jgi:hypothetical protein